MCGRVIQASPPDQLGLKIIDALAPRDNRVTGDPFGNVPPRYNGAPSEQLWVIRQNPQTGERSLDLLQWGLIPYWCKDKPKPPPNGPNLLQPFPSEPMAIWPISTRVNSPKNDDADLLKPLADADAC